MKRFQKAAVVVGAIAVAAATVVATPAIAAGDYNVTVKGVSSGKLIANVKPGATPSVKISNIPANVGLTILWCELPSDPTTDSPKYCDWTNKNSRYDVAAMADVRSISEKITLRTSFTGTDKASGKTRSVDCQIPAPNNLGAVCAIYVMDSASPANAAYTKYFRIAFKNEQKKNDSATVKLAGKTIGSGSQPKLKYEVPVKFVVSLKSKILPRISTSPDCKYEAEAHTLKALASSETCTVLITSPGNSSYAPLVRTQTFTLAINK